MNKLTIQINNLEALERLIGGDSEVEIDIRNSVVQKFAEKHLKALANAPAITSTLNTIKAHIGSQISEKCAQEIGTFQQSWSGDISSIKLHPKIKEEIDRQVRTLTDKNIQNAVDEALKFWVNDVELKKRIDNRFEYYTNQHINAEVRARLEKVKASLG